MKKLLLALALVAVPLFAEAPHDAPLPGWMAGTWIMEDGANWSNEVWLDPRGGVMLGMARNGFGSELLNWANAQIRKEKDGSILLVVQPHGQREAEFPMVLVSEEAIEFANPKIKYPQRVRYWRQGKLLMAEASNLDGSDVTRWNYRQVIPPQEN